ncbi:PQQ-dependent sugar dehydrogenase [Alteromonas oceanisediminis]|uniref:PQQ-dependent sugar dehydrogenase n=1 Tax=Alteromonas oceanisediminis TaxID=2836180 RepID=UPI001BD987E2|nr:PQQ-dependent sugar dehydrogenase [Alteromonas oceanisediminis]MBT0586003.1 sorbosone dehydrogenase family protein [Alteromonas oceanisediminis]
MKQIFRLATTAALLSLTSGTIALADDVKERQHTTVDEVSVVELAEGLVNPWGMAELPNGDFLINERPGTMRRFSNGKLGEPISGVPDVVAQNQGGLLGITTDPEFSSNNTIYFCYSSPGDEGATSTVASARLDGNALSDVTVLFEADPRIDTGFHFGCRVVIDGKGDLYISMGDRGSQRYEAQNTNNHFGTVARIKRDGSVPDDNPFTDGKAPEIFSYGHRNVQGMTVHPNTDDVWTHEHGPKGGDEVNILKKAANYGWPTISYGINYDGSPVTDKTAQEGMEQPLMYWDPSIAPSGMDFYEGDVFEQWQGDLLVGSLKFDHLRRIELDKNNQVVAEHEMLRDHGERVRDVMVGSDGYIYVLTDERNGKLLKLMPK